ncbi:uncharacterized protein LOC121936412 [Sceloporus undulatus]|uniref:uncharacterized protein LOC121936412 n=1 Tax=Sceloporus undulatus TaxID=8520 RepID=UPI001C4B3AE3|nr:uncharacterized protein LOC121936412 [Sceloporus undulatus]
MAIHWGLMIMLVCGVSEAEGSLLEFGALIKELTNKSSFPDYTSYGCYCGLGGKGQPRDATDSCCFDHDCCYGRLSNCSTKTDKYEYTIEDGGVTCALPGTFDGAILLPPPDPPRADFPALQVKIRNVFVRSLDSESKRSLENIHFETCFRYSTEKEDDRETMATDVVKRNASLYPVRWLLLRNRPDLEKANQGYIDMLPDAELLLRGFEACFPQAWRTIPCVLPVASGNLIQFADMIRRVTGKPSSLAYNGYGCYCGLGGWKQPRDETDWCCHAHDCCYGRMSSLGCDPKMEIYSYFIQERNIVCGGETMCQRMICECDKAATLCFRTSAYSIRNIYFPNFLCRGATPPC